MLSFIHKRRTAISVGIILLPFIVVAAITGLHHPFDFDEGDYHVPVVEQFIAEVPALDLVNYRSATTPLMHLTLAVWGMMVGTESWKLRLPVLLAGMLSSVIFFILLRERKEPWPLRITFFLVASPYFFWLSFLVMTEVFAFLFGILALRYFLRTPSKRRDMAFFALWGSLAVLARQQWLFLPLGAGLYWLWQDRDLRRAAWAAIPVLVFLPFVILWGGTAPPIKWATPHDLTINLVQIPHVFIVIGFYFFPALFTAPVSWRRLALPTLAALPFFAFTPLIENAPSSLQFLSAQSAFSGLIAKVGNLAAGFLPPIFIYASFFVLFIIGALILFQAWRRRYEDHTERLWFVMGAFFLMLLTVGQAWERYLLPAIPLFILIFYAPQRNHRWILNPWLAVQLFLLSGFLFYQIALP
jgi:hypothetical protein